MGVPSPSTVSLERVADGRVLLVVVAFALAAWIGTIGPGPVGTGTVPLPVLLGLAAHGGADRQNTVERLATELEEFAARLRREPVPSGTEPDRTDSIRDADVDFELDRDDEVGRLSDVVAELAATVQERERQYAERERQHSRAMSNVPGMIYRCRNEPDWPFEFASEGCLTVTGYEPDALESDEMCWADDVIAGDNRELWETVQDALEDREPFQVVYPIDTADGERRWVSEQGRGVFDEDGSLEALEGVIVDVTERVENERRFDRTMRLLEQSQRLANVGTWELDVTDEPYELWWTDEAARIHDLSPDADVDLERVLEIYHPEDRPKLRAAIERAVDAGDPYDLELRLNSGGDQRWGRAIGEPVQEDGETVTLRGSIQDVTEQKRRERELERYEAIVQAIGDPVYTLDSSGTVRFVNDAIESLAGYDPETMIGSDLSEILAPPDIETARELIRELLREEKPYETFEMDLETADGDVIETETHVALLPMDDGKFAGTAGVIRNITERKERERALEESEQRARTLIENFPNGAVGLYDEDLRYTLVGGERIADLDVTREELVGMSIYERYDEETIADLEPKFRAALAGEHHTFEFEFDGTELHVQTLPVRNAEGEVFAGMLVVQDVSEQKRRERALRSLHETARGLLNAETETSVGELVVEAATDLLESASASVYLLDEGTNRFEPISSTADFADRFGDVPSVGIGDGDSVLWHTYATGAQTVVDGTEVADQAPLFGGDSPGGLLVPIGDHGVFVLGVPAATIDEETRQLIETLVATTEAAFDRLESEASLRERDAELEARNRRLRRQVQVTEIIRGIDRSLIGADSRADIERTVPERLVEADGVAFAWVGDLDATGTALEPRTWAGTDPEYLDTRSFDLDGDSAEPAVRTARSETPTVVENVVEGLQHEPWRTSAIDAGFQSVVSVPLSFEEYRYGVLTVYADEPDAFTDLERTVFAELGEGIANAITAAETRAALHSESLVELALELEADDVLSRIASTIGAPVVYEGLGTDSGAETILFFGTDGVPAADVQDALEDLVGVTEYRLVSASDDDLLFEATVSGDVVASRLVRHGASPRSIRADGTVTEVTVDVPTTTDVREFVEMLEDHYEAVELRSRRHVERTAPTEGSIVASLFDDLTDRQLEVLRTAYLAGFFEWPRESTGEEIADMLGVTQPTVNRHLRIGQQRLLTRLFEEEPVAR